MSVAILMATSFFGQYQESFSSFLSSLPASLIKGTASGPYWYIPFIVPIFLLGPLLIKLKSKHLKKCLPLLLILPLLGTRSGITVTPETYLYFFPIYLLGVYTSMHYKTVVKISQKYFKLILFCVLVLCSAIFVMCFSEQDFTYSIFSLKDGLVYLKCLLAAMIFIHICENIAKKKLRTLNTLANYSFALYFLHYFINYRIIFISYRISNYFLFDESIKILWGLIWAFVVILVTLATCIIAKKIFGKYSRPFIGV